MRYIPAFYLHLKIKCAIILLELFNISLKI
ncbi:hypothetical protein mphiCDS_0004 [Staphylococcus phage mosaic phi11]